MIQAKRMKLFILVLLLLISFVLPVYILAYDTPPDNENEIKEKLKGIISSQERDSKPGEDGIIKKAWERANEYLGDKFEKSFSKNFNRKDPLMETEAFSWVYAFLKYVSIVFIAFVILIVGYFISKIHLYPEK